MAYKHGVYISEQATSLLPVVQTDAAMAFVVGTAPVWKATEPAEVNTPVLIYSAAEAAKYLGFEMTDNFGDYTLSEFFYAAFGLFGIAPICVVNVFDPSVHKTAVTGEAVAFADKLGKLAHVGILASSLVLKPSAGGAAYAVGTDYTVDLKTGLISATTGGALANATGCTADYSYADPSKVTSTDIIGGIDVTTLKPEGLECVAQVFPRFRLVPGFIAAPKFSADPAVALVMAAKCEGLNGHFKCVAPVDLPTVGTNAVKDYTLVSGYKETNGLTNKYLTCCWPKGIVKGDTSSYEFHLSTLLCCAAALLDSQSEGVPYASPSNQGAQVTGACLAGGESVWLDTNMAALLNGNGIVTLLNFIGGWKLWGNRMACYPSDTDVKDSFIPIRRMFNWVGNQLVLTFWQKVDAPITKRLIQTIVDSLNIWLNGLAARNYLLGGRVEFRDDENPTTDIMDGIIRLHVYMTPPSPAREIEFIQEYDPSYIKTLFS